MNYLQDPHTLVEHQQRSSETTLQRAVETEKKDSKIIRIYMMIAQCAPAAEGREMISCQDQQRIQDQPQET